MFLICSIFRPATSCSLSSDVLGIVARIEPQRNLGPRRQRGNADPGFRWSQPGLGRCGAAYDVFQSQASRRPLLEALKLAQVDASMVSLH